MYRVEQVLIPVDFSSFSRSALEFVRNLSASNKEEGRPRLQLGHVVPEMSSYMRRILFPYAALGEDDREFEAEIVEEARGELYRHFSVDEALEKRFVGEPVVEFGVPHERISEWAGRFDIDLIALGVYGEHGVVAGRLGSTAARIMRSSTVPVVLIRDHDRKPRIRRILVAIDLSLQTPEILRVAAGIALQHKAELDLVHILPSPFLYDTNGLLEKEIDYDETKMVKGVRPTIDALFERVVEDVDFPFAYREKAQRLLQTLSVRAGDPAEEIAKMGYEGEYDLVVVGTNSRKGQRGGSSLGRVSAEAVVKVPTHVMVVPSVQKQTPLVELDEG